MRRLRYRKQYHSNPLSPPQVTLDRIRKIAVSIAESFNVSGPFNMQLIAKVSDRP